MEARTKAGISLTEFNEMPGTPMWLHGTQTMSKSHLLIWYRKSSRITAAQNSAQMRKMKHSSGKHSGSNFIMKRR